MTSENAIIKKVVVCQRLTHLQLTDFGVRRLEIFRQFLLRLLGLFHSSTESVTLHQIENREIKLDI